MRLPEAIDWFNEATDEELLKFATIEPIASRLSSQAKINPRKHMMALVGAYRHKDVDNYDEWLINVLFYEG